MLIVRSRKHLLLTSFSSGENAVLTLLQLIPNLLHHRIPLRKMVKDRIEASGMKEQKIIVEANSRELYPTLDDNRLMMKKKSAS